MPIRRDPARPDWRVLEDAAGPVATFLYVEREGRRVADLFEGEAPLDRVVAAARNDLRGWRIAGDERLGAALLTAGGRLFRHAHVYTHDLAVVPAAPPGTLPLRHDAAALVPAYLAAYGPGHPAPLALDVQEPADLPAVGAEQDPPAATLPIHADGHRREMIAGRTRRLPAA